MLRTNPLIQRYRYSLLRPRQFGLHQIIYFGVVGLIILINSLIFLNSKASRIDLFKSIFYQIFVFEVFILWLWTSSNSSSAIQHELHGKTYDFFKLMPLSAVSKAVGILVGANLVALLFTAYNIFLLVLFGFLGQVDFRLQANIFLAVLSIALVLNALSPLGSLRSENRHDRTSVGGFIVLMLLLTPALIGGGASLLESGAASHSMRFYFLHIPTAVMIALISLYFFCWSFAGILRKFRCERRPLFTYPGALWFMAGFSIVVAGFLWAYLRNPGMRGLYSFWSLTFIPHILIPFGAAKNYDMYLEGLRLSKYDGSSRNLTWWFLKNSNLFLWLSLFVVWTLFSIGIALKSGEWPLPFMSSILLLFSFVSFFAVLLELHMLYQFVYTKVKWLLGFIALTYVLLPLILGAALTNVGLLQYSPVGYFIQLFDQAAAHGSMGHATGVLMLNSVLCGICFCFIWKKYSEILGLRRKIGY